MITGTQEGLSGEPGQPGENKVKILIQNEIFNLSQLTSGVTPRTADLLVVW